MKLSIPSFVLVLALTTSLSAEDSTTSFNFSSWKKSHGALVSIDDWKKENPSPYRGYFPATDEKSLAAWTIDLGPLGVITRMHDRSWEAFPAVPKLYPPALTDEHGLAFNNFEILSVKKNSPADGRLLPGDLILGMDGTPLKAAQHMFLDRAVDNKCVRGLEIHAGNLIDRAEGRGEIKLNVLRLPGGMKKTSLKKLRSWKKVKSITVDGTTKVSIPLKEADLVKIVSTQKKLKIECENFVLRNAEGQTVPVILSIPKTKIINIPLEVPDGNWTLEGTLTSTKKISLNIETIQAPQLPKNLKKFIKTITLKIDPIGSFGEKFDPNSTKAKNYSDMLAHRLAVQQNSDGSWVTGGYASLSFHTSICALALMSTDNPQFEPNIKRAAHYVANPSNRDGWSYSNGMWLVFLSEYYLKTKDESILPAITMHIKNCRRFILSDYTSGHGLAKPGYGGSGYIGGGGVIALGLAVAGETPAMSEDDLAVLDKMLDRAQEIAPGGKIPYGRVGKSQKTTPSPGQGVSCATGPYFLASLIRGGADHFTKMATSRYSTAPFGSAEDGHASQTLHFFWGCLSSLNCSAQAHQENMSTYLWKFTTLRGFDGFINKNNYATQYHSGDGVVGEPYWRTAGYLMLMNAHRHNLAITGNLKYRTAPRHLPVAFHRDIALHNEMLRNWALAEAYLGKEAPSSFVQALSELRALKVDVQLGTSLRTWLKGAALASARDILALKNLPKDVPAGQLAEMILGVAFEASCFPDPTAGFEKKMKGLDKRARKIAKKKFTNEFKKLLKEGKLKKLTCRFKIYPLSRIQKEVDTKPGISPISTALFPIENLKIQIADPSKKYLSKSISKSFDVYAKPRKKNRGDPDIIIGDMGLVDMNVGVPATFLVKVTYTLAGLPISYTATMHTTAPEDVLPGGKILIRRYVPTLCLVPVKGSVTVDYSDSYSPLILLETGEVVGCEQRNQPAPYILAGSSYQFAITPGSMWANELRFVKPLTPNNRLAKVTKFDGVSDGNKLIDHDFNDGADLKAGTTSIIMHLSKPEEIALVYLSFKEKNAKSKWSKIPYKFEAMVDGKWNLLHRGILPGMLPTIRAKTTQVKLTLEVPNGGMILNEVHLITPAPPVKKSQLSW